MQSKFLHFVMVLALALGLTACGGGGKDEAQTETTTDSSTVESADSSSQEAPEREPMRLEPGKTPFDFPTVATKGKEGEYVLCPGYKMWQNKLAAKDPAAETYIFYTAEMVKPGEVESEIKFTFDGNQKMPNAMLIPIPKGQTAKVGDVVLTWWQTGWGMQRAIVTEASNPAEPTVRYLDLDWDNPAKDSKSGKGIGQTEYKLKPDSFVGIDAFSPGSTIAAKENGKWNSVQVVSMADGKVLTLGFAGKMKVYDRKDCFAIPQKINVSPGEKVKAVWVGAYRDATVVKVESKMGLVFVKYEGMDKEEAVSFGEITKQLPE
ncbi:MAG: hypothetical protein OHK0053_36670 [Microscillaceae bacterium]